jgi:CheY-like chemotaxis protein
MEMTLPTITADRSHLEQVLLNLTVNARDAMPRGGTLTIGTAATELDQAYCCAHPEATPGHYVELAVSDTGTGMRPDVAARIFEPFFTTRAIGHGLGIGLSIVHGVVTQAGGSINVQSETGSGTVFRLYLPAAAPPAAAPAAPDDPGRLDLKSILVVDDEPAILELVSRILTKNGYSVLEAHSGEEALSVASTHDFDLLLTDSLMPQMSGPELVERFAEIKPGLRVLHMSGYSVGQLNTVLTGHRSGAILDKPFTPQTLLEKVRAALTAPRQLLRFLIGGLVRPDADMVGLLGQFDPVPDAEAPGHLARELNPAGPVQRRVFPRVQRGLAALVGRRVSYRLAARLAVPDRDRPANLR